MLQVRTRQSRVSVDGNSCPFLGKVHTVFQEESLKFEVECSRTNSYIAERLHTTPAYKEPLEKNEKKDPKEPQLISTPSQGRSRPME
jgi:hypothetical protein